MHMFFKAAAAKIGHKRRACLFSEVSSLKLQTA